MNRSNTYIRSGVVQERGSARNPWKARPWIPNRNEPFDKAKVAQAIAVKRPSFLQRDAVVRSLRSFGIPGAGAYDYSYRASQGGYQLTTTAGGSAVAKLAKIRDDLTGKLVVDALSKSATYTVQIQFPTFSSGSDFRKAIGLLSRRMNVYARARERLGDTVVPLYFAGLHPGLGAYVTVLAEVPPSAGAGAKDAGAFPVFHRLVDAGVYPATANAVRKTPDGRYIVANPALLLEVPRGIHIAYDAYRREEGPVEAWLSAGGAVWADAYTHFKFHGTGRVLRDSPITFRNTMNQHLALSLDRRETGSASKRPVDPHVEKVLGEITARSKKLGEGAYGQVFGVTLNPAMRKRLTTIQAALTNTLEFDSIKGESHVVLKLEKLDPIRALSAGEVRRLAGEAYTQQYVHTNSGIPDTGGRRPMVVSPGVYFSGTLANKYHLICMEHVNGVPLSKVSRGFVPEALYNAMTAAVKVLIRNGVVHSDLHRNNVFVVKRGRSIRVQILDFGFASIVPPRMRVRMVSALDETDSIDAVYRTTGLIEAVNAEKTGYEYYHSNTKLVALLRWMRNRGPMVGVRSHPIARNDASPRGGTVERAQRGLRKLRVKAADGRSSRSSSRSSRSSSRSVLRRGRSTPTRSTRSTRSVASTKFASART